MCMHMHMHAQLALLSFFFSRKSHMVDLDEIKIKFASDNQSIIKTINESMEYDQPQLLKWIGT